ncbi:MAG: 2-oxoisovalerate dehydrogenase [Spirochaetes bacterium RBG_16_49_21]|nr:MAG: 2-oxoisovalerate dehydrogenase [Spirochaetes bacterium RBG_16_49_21]
MKNEIIFYIEESIEGGYEAKALGYSIFTEGDTLDELKTNIRDAVQCHFDEQNMPQIIKLHFVREEAIVL